MHFVDRGPEPNSLPRYRQTYTPKWVKHYQDGTGPKPADSHWRRFQTQLGEAFAGICGYCEAICKGEVDHFRPKSRFPARVYDWSNWVFACHDCNHQKGQKWPKSGYVDPCARASQSRPERFFEFDVQSGEILPKAGLNPARRQKAQMMIDDLKLNAYHHLKGRLLCIHLIAEVLAGENQSDPGHHDFARRVSERNQPFSSIIRVFLAERGRLADAS